MVDSGGVDECLMTIGMNIDDCLTSWKSREIDDLDESEQIIGWIVLDNRLVSTVLRIKVSTYLARLNGFCGDKYKYLEFHIFGILYLISIDDY